MVCPSQSGQWLPVAAGQRIAGRVRVLLGALLPTASAPCPLPLSLTSCFPAGHTCAQPGGGDVLCDRGPHTRGAQPCRVSPLCFAPATTTIHIGTMATTHPTAPTTKRRTPDFRRRLRVQGSHQPDNGPVALHEGKAERGCGRLGGWMDGALPGVGRVGWMGAR